MDEIKDCFKKFVNVGKLQEEIERYKPTGDLDFVFQNYCRETPVLSMCVSNLAAAIDPCLDPKGKENMKVILNTTDSFLKFVCFREGDRIALFVSADGPECLQSKQQEIQQCVNTTFGSYIPALGPNNGPLAGLAKLLPLVFGTKECTCIPSFGICVVKNLEECSDVIASLHRGFYILLYFTCNAVPGFIDQSQCRFYSHDLFVLIIQIVINYQMQLHLMI